MCAPRRIGGMTGIHAAQLFVYPFARDEGVNEASNCSTHRRSVARRTIE
jgi:hypothetical protein